MQHQRKKHTDRVAPAAKIRRVQNVVAMPTLDLLDNNSKVVTTILQPTVDRSHHQQQDLTDLTPMAAVLNQPGAMVTVQGDAIQGADLLTQAMSELTQSLGEFRPQAEFQVTAGGKILQNATIIQPGVNQQHTTIELSALGQSFAQAAQFQTQPQGQITVSGGNAGVSQVLSAVQPITLAVNSDGQTQNTGVPITIAHTFIPRTWTTTNVANLATFRQIQ